MFASVTGIAVKANGQPAAAVTVIATLSGPLTSPQLVTKLTYTAETSQTGAWSLSLPVTADPTVEPHGAYYVITEPVSGLNVQVGLPPSDVPLDVTQLPVLALAPQGSGDVLSVFGRTGAVLAQTGDYTVSKVTGALGGDLSGTLPNPGVQNVRGVAVRPGNVAAFVLADSAPTLPVVIVLATNDQLIYTPAATGVPETFTLAPGTYTTLANVIAALAAAAGTSADTLADYLSATPDAGKILLSAVVAGSVSNGDTITEGNGAAAVLGFTANPDTLHGGVGGVGDALVQQGDGSYAPVPVVSVASPPSVVGQVPTWDGTDWEPQAGGGAPAGASIVRAFPFTFDSPDLLTGHAVYTPTVGDVLLDAWVEIGTKWNGTTPLGDLGTFDTEGVGVWKQASTKQAIPMDLYHDAGYPRGAISNLSVGYVLSGLRDLGVLTQPTQSFDSLYAVTATTIDWADDTPISDGSRLLPGIFTAATPLKVCVSQDGTNTGADPGSTQGAAILYLITATPV